MREERLMKNNKEYIAPYAEVVEVNLKALMLWSGGEQIISDPTGGETEGVITYPEDKPTEW